MARSERTLQSLLSEQLYSRPVAQDRFPAQRAEQAVVAEARPGASAHKEVASTD